MNNERLKIKVSDNPRVTCVWASLDVPDNVRRWCRENAVFIGMDAFGRFQFKGRRSAIVKLINDHIAPTKPDLRQKITDTIIEA